MTEAERRKLPWYGGNKIPDSYLKKFLPSQGDEADPEMSYDLRLFLHGMGDERCHKKLQSQPSLP